MLQNKSIHSQSLILLVSNLTQAKGWSASRRQCQADNAVCYTRQNYILFTVSIKLYKHCLKKTKIRITETWLTNFGIAKRQLLKAAYWKERWEWEHVVQKQHRMEACNQQSANNPCLASPASRALILSALCSPEGGGKTWQTKVGWWCETDIDKGSMWQVSGAMVVVEQRLLSISMSYLFIIIVYC